MLKDVARILRLIGERPNERFEPRSDDLQGHFTSWFDGGAVNEVTGYTSYEFDDGSEAMTHVLGYFYISVTLADGTKITVIEETQRSGRELLRIGQRLLSQDEEAETIILERPNTEGDNSPTAELDFPNIAKEFEFCTRCGHRVEPYLQSDTSHGEIEYQRKTLPSVSDDSHYFCQNCDQIWLALSYRDTSIICGNCKVWMPFIAVFCGNCGAKHSGRGLC